VSLTPGTRLWDHGRTASGLGVCGPCRWTAVPDAWTRCASRNVADHCGTELVGGARV